MKDPLAYTYDGIEQQLNLLEIHLKEAPNDDEAFCNDCINKHIQTIRGFAIEGTGFAKTYEERKIFAEAEKQIKSIKGKDYQKHGYEFAKKVRQIRKSLSHCPGCDTIKNATKHLNTNLPFNDDTHNSNHVSDYNQLNGEKKNMVKYSTLMYMNAGQFTAEGLKYVAETYPSTEPGKYSNYVTIGGGILLQALPLFVKMPETLKSVSMVTGSNLLADGVVKMVKGATSPAVVMGPRASLNAAPAVANAAAGKFTGRPNGRVFGGRVTAANVPSQYARSGILSEAQAFSDPEHAGMIRID